MTRLYLIRHGETAWNSDGRYQGWTDIPLSEIGEKQAELLGKRFESIDLDAIYASPLKRAYKTAQAVAKYKNMNIITTEHLKEINFGEWEGFTVPELKELYGDSFIRFLKEPYKNDFPGEGSFELVMKRVKIGIDKILSENENKNIMIVSHGGIVRIAIMYLMGFDGDFYAKTWLDNTSMSIVDIKKGRRLLLTLNDKSHLENVKLK